MALSARALRLLEAIERAHDELAAYANADAAARSGLRAVYLALAAGLEDIDDEWLLAQPAPEEWSMAEVAEHVAVHDHSYRELPQHGISHYVEHGLEHAQQLWRLRNGVTS